MKRVSFCGRRGVALIGLGAVLFVGSAGTASSTVTTAVPPSGSPTTTTAVTWVGNVTGPGTAAPEDCANPAVDPLNFCSDFQLEITTPGFIDAFINWENEANDLGLQVLFCSPVVPGVTATCTPVVTSACPLGGTMEGVNFNAQATAATDDFYIVRTFPDIAGAFGETYGGTAQYGQTNFQCPAEPGPVAVDANTFLSCTDLGGQDSFADRVKGNGQIPLPTGVMSNGDDDGAFFALNVARKLDKQTGAPRLKGRVKYKEHKEGDAMGVRFRSDEVFCARFVRGSQFAGTSSREKNKEATGSVTARGLGFVRQDASKQWERVCFQVEAQDNNSDHGEPSNGTPDRFKISWSALSQDATTCNPQQVRNDGEVIKGRIRYIINDTSNINE